ncbi:uncharacterized protein LOC113508028 [Trichoplusia ni]|uniref:Uncharacterized protein LOC113508028 n=1 Tax=Trichoplusia ni TaxID=7111 RepID=A0A7E5X2W7_TRINI|nr:uncharacterized protein LOC113508028 [Trichoplusia ni]
MIFYLLLCNFLFIPIVYSKNITSSKPEIANKNLTESHEIFLPNKTKEKLLSEGGEILPDTSILDSPKDKHDMLMSLDSETGKNKVKSVVARKGVVYTEDNSEKPQKTLSTLGESSIDPLKVAKKTETLNTQLNNVTHPVVLSKVNETLVNNINKTKEVNTTEVHLKPRVLSYDKVVNMTVKTPSAATVYDHILTPKKELKAYTKNANSHPGMIMPLVITILLVPMFAVLGYMALRRGQEAWKNRHYKRMDFLLDGMYND